MRARSSSPIQHWRIFWYCLLLIALLGPVGSSAWHATHRFVVTTFQHSACAFSACWRAYRWSGICADDVPLERIPASLIATGELWAGIEAFWGDLVHELPNIPDGGSDYFVEHVKPSLGGVQHLSPI